MAPVWGSSAHEVAHLAVDRRVRKQGAVADARGLRVRRAVQDHALVRVDDLVAGRPPGAVVDGPGGLVAAVEGVEEARARTHLDARRLEAEGRRGRAVVRPSERDPLVDGTRPAEVLQVVAGG